MASTFGFVIIGIAVWASATRSSHAGLPPDTEGSSPEAAQTLNTGCFSNADCPINNFCEGRGPRKRCTDCMDCAKFQRKPKKSYDGESCATHPSECGECNDGYEELGGECAPKTISQTPSSTPIYVHEVFGKTANEEINEAGMLTWPVAIFGGLILIFSVCLITMLVGKRHLKKLSGRNRNEEEAGLTTAYHNGSYEGPTHAPTAPQPEEYDTRPHPYVPYWPCAFDASKKPPCVRLAEATVETALPFNNGYAATDGRDYMNEYANGPANIPDAVDGAAASTPTEDVPAPANNGTDSTDNVRNIPSSSVGQQRQPVSATANMNMGANHPLISQSNQPPQPFGHVPPHGQNPANNDIQASFQFLAYLGVRLRHDPSSAATASDSAAQPSASARIIMTSAPVSPRRIDDTHVDVSEIQGVFQEGLQESNVSLDSGTGSVLDRSVPSRPGSSGSYGFDDSMYEDDYGSPHSPPAQVPQQEDQDLDDEDHINHNMFFD